MCVFKKVKGYDHPPRSPLPTRKCGKTNRLFSACIYTFFSWEFPNFQVLCLLLYRRNFNTQMVYWNWARLGFHFQVSRKLSVKAEPLALQKSGNHHQPPIFYGLYVSIHRPFFVGGTHGVEISKKGPETVRRIFFQPGFVFGVWYFLCWMVTSEFCFKPKDKGDYFGGYKFDSSKATSLSMLILNRNWKNSK